MINKTYFLTAIIITLLLSCKGQIKEADKTHEVSLKLNANLNFVFPQIHGHLNGMVSEFIFKTFEDKKGNFWFCTNHDGVIQYDGKKLIKYGKESGVGATAVRAFAIDKTGTLWFGTSSGLTKFDGEKFTNFALGEKINDNEIWSLAIDNEGLIWVATNSGLSTFDGKTFEPFIVPKAEVPTPKPMLAETRIAQILIDTKGQKWFVTDGYGITKYDGKHFTFFTQQNGLTDNNVAAIFEDSKGNIWIGTFNGGVSKYDGLTYTHFTKDGKIEGLETANFCEDQAGNIWFSAEGLGVYKYDGNNFTLFAKKDGLTSNNVQHIYVDAKGQVWFCTWQGISLYDGKSITDIAEKEPWTK